MNAIIVNGRSAGWNFHLESDPHHKKWLTIEVVAFCWYSCTTSCFRRHFLYLCGVLLLQFFLLASFWKSSCFCASVFFCCVKNLCWCLLLPVTFLPLLSTLLHLQDFFLSVFPFLFISSSLKFPPGYFASVCCALRWLSRWLGNAAPQILFLYLKNYFNIIHLFNGKSDF